MLSYLVLLALAIFALLTATVSVRLFLERKRRRESRRGLFVYSDGKRVRSVDPISAILTLEAHKDFRFDRHPKQAADGDKEAIAICADAVREAFSVPAYSAPGKPGLTVAECYSLLQAFGRYVALQKKSISLSATFAQSTVSTSGPSEPATTNDTLPSGSSAVGVA